MQNGSQSPENRKKEKERGDASTGSGTQMKGGWSQRGRGGSSMGRPDDVRDQSRGSGTLGVHQHTEAGSTGTSGGQISPQPGMAERTRKSETSKDG